MQKFAPKVRIRSAERATKAGASAGAASAASEDRFKELIKQAQSDKAWQRGAGRGRGARPADEPKQQQPDLPVLPWPHVHSKL